MQRSSLSARTLLVLSFAALGVVYGDIGTSPLYAVSGIFFGHGQIAVDPATIFGAISLIFWALTLIVTLKYVVFVLRAEYEGEGGIFALLGLLKGMSVKGIAFISSLLILAAGLLLGDGIITPAISVLSAVEGLAVKTNAFAPYVVPITMIVLTILFFFQQKGTAKLGKMFGAVMTVWFATIALLGLRQVIGHPAILQAVNPWYALQFMAQVGAIKTMFVLGAVVLAVTGGEALYADLGHFGVRPIRISWLFLVYPALILNYMGQGAFLLSGAPILVHNIFYSLVPPMLLLPMVILATMATVIASQALISGAFSLAAQATALGVSPRFKIVHTSQTQKGQIYVPMINWALYVGCMVLVLIFRSSNNLAAAYGLAETGVMISTSIAIRAIAKYKWHWHPAKTWLIFGTFICVDAVFLISNSLKFFQGGYVPFTVGILLFTVMMTWRWGRAQVYGSYDVFEAIRPLSWLLSLKERVAAGNGVLIDEKGRTVELNRAVVFMSSKSVSKTDDPLPVVARLYLKRKGAVPKCIVFLNIAVDKEPYLEGADSEVRDFGSNVFAVNARYGFMEAPQVRELLASLNEKGQIPYDLTHSTIEIAEPDIILQQDVSQFDFLRIRLYKLLRQVATPMYRYFGLNADANLSTTLIPISVTDAGMEVVRLQNERLEI
jgi:KUP system potassium uptake protein